LGILESVGGVKFFKTLVPWNYIRPLIARMVISSILLHSFAPVLSAAHLSLEYNPYLNSNCCVIKQHADLSTHKGTHAALGVATGAVLSKDKKKGAISGAIGAVIAETVAEHLPLSPLPGPGIDTVLTRPSLPQRGEVAKLVATTVSTLSGLDAEVSLRTADTAVRFNCENHQLMTEEEQECARQMLADNEELPLMKSAVNL